MKGYLDIARGVLEKGVHKPTRTGVDTWAIPPTYFKHDMSQGFPLLTTKRMPFGMVKSELEFFIKGLTDKRWLQERKNSIWDEWANPKVVPYVPLQGKTREAVLRVTGRSYVLNEDILKIHDKFQRDETYLRGILSEEERVAVREIAANRRAMFDERDLGAVYGFQWRHFGAEYKGVDHDYTGEGVDQLARAIGTLKVDPNNRKQFVSAWNPKDLDKQALEPCHYGFHPLIIGGKLHLVWNQRSVDVPLGLPFNIASYGLLLHLLAKELNVGEGQLSGSLDDTHVYVNQRSGLEEQLSREPRPLPRIETPHFTSIFDWKADDTKLIPGTYNPHPGIVMPIAV